MGTSNQFNVSTGVQARIPAPKNGRDSLFIQNNSGNTIYYSEDTPLQPSTTANGIAIGGGLFLTVDQTQGKAVPQGTIYLLGSTAALQSVIVKEG